MTPPLRKFPRWTSRQRLRTEMCVGSLAESWIMKRARGRQRSRSKVTYALILPAIIQVISQRSSGKKELDWLSTPAATARMPTAIGLNVKQQVESGKLARIVIKV